MRVRERKSYRQRVYGKQVETDRDSQRFTQKKECTGRKEKWKRKRRKKNAKQHTDIESW